jgi:hypothetical protein
MNMYQEIVKKKEDLEKNILDFINKSTADFYKETGFPVRDVLVMPYEHRFMDGEVVYGISKVEVSLSV